MKENVRANFLSQFYLTNFDKLTRDGFAKDRALLWKTRRLGGDEDCILVLFNARRREMRITHTLAVSQFYTRRDSLSHNQYISFKRRSL